MIQIKNAKELDGMRKANALSAAALKYGGEHIEAGMTTWELDKLIYDFIVKHGGIPNFKGLYGFPGTACISLNDTVIHGIPSHDIVIRPGDIVSIDTGAKVDGFNGDNACTYAVGKVDLEAQRLLDVNFFGMVRMNRQVLPVMRKQGYGRIVNLSSVAGAIPIPFQTYYSASKAAINSYTMALANEVKPFGIQVCCVQPGDIRTGFTAAREKNPEGDDIYGGRIARSVAGMERDEQNGMDPEKAGAFIAHVATRKGIRPVNTIGLQYKFFCFLVKILPAKTLNWLVGLIYAK